MIKDPVLIILGPTASGKSALAVRLAKRLNGEIISADSRQVYRGLDLGSGKITKKERGGIPHYLLDIANPKRVFTVAHYQKLVKQKIGEIRRRGKLPIICGGTGFYIQAAVDNLVLPVVKPDRKLRAKLQRKNVLALFKILQKLDPERAAKIDRNNPHRLIRAIEIARALGSVPKLSVENQSQDLLLTGLNPPPETLKKLIKTRLAKRLRAGLIAEVRQLRKSGLSWQRLEAFGLEYRFVALYLQGKLDKKELVERLNNAIWHYAKRQLTWFRRDSRIHWFTNSRLASAFATKTLGQK